MSNLSVIWVEMKALELQLRPQDLDLGNKAGIWALSKGFGLEFELDLSSERPDLGSERPDLGS